MAGNELAYLKVQNLPTKSSTFSNSDYFAALDNATGKVQKLAASKVGVQTGATQQVVYNAKVNATLAEINAGKTLLAEASGVTIRPIGVTVQCDGTFLSGTSVIVRSTNASPVVLTTLAQANLADNAVIKDGETGSTRGVGISADLTAGDGVEIAKSGADFTGGTSIDFDIQYTKTV